MQGASPLASPGLNPGGTGEGWRLTRRRGGTAVLVAGLFPTLAFFLPPSPRPPSPPGKGETKVIFMQGASPLASPGAETGCYNKFEESSGGSGGLFQESPGASLPLASPGAEAGCYNKFEESSGGFGGLFQESPGASPPAGCPECGEITGFFQTRGSRRAGSFGYR